MHYLIQVNLYLIVFFAFYLVFLKKETFYQANRFYLMLSGIVSFVIPFMQTEWVKSWFVTQEVSDFIAAYDASMLDIPITPVSGSRFLSLREIILGIYALGLLAFTGLFAVNVIKTLRIVARFNPEGSQAFSFFGRIRIGRELAQYKAVLDHERVHVAQCHSFDILLFEAIAILCWVNPVAYFLKKEIKLLHEYQADEFASKNSASKAYYAALLIGQKFGISPETILVNSFFTKSLLKARIEMLGREESHKRALVKYGFVVPIFLGMMVFASASIAKSDNLKGLEKYTDEVVFEATKPKVEPRNVKEVKIDLSDYQKGGTVKSLSEEDLSFKKPELLPPPPPVEKNPTVDEVFVGVEQAPSFVGGDREMYHFLSENIVYPAPATRANVQGRVTVQFIIEKDGSVSNAKVLKGLGFGLDEESIRVVSSMPKWTPGTQNGRPVRVYYTIPIMFTLSDD